MQSPSPRCASQPVRQRVQRKSVKARNDAQGDAASQKAVRAAAGSLSTPSAAPWNPCHPTLAVSNAGTAQNQTDLIWAGPARLDLLGALRDPGWAGSHASPPLQPHWQPGRLPGGPAGRDHDRDAYRRRPDRAGGRQRDGGRSLRVGGRRRAAGGAACSRDRAAPWIAWRRAPALPCSLSKLLTSSWMRACPPRPCCCSCSQRPRRRPSSGEVRGALATPRLLRDSPDAAARLKTPPRLPASSNNLTTRTRHP